MKDCFISNDTSFNGTFKCDGNIIIEGHVEGDVICDNLVKIESGGYIRGVVRGQQVLINGTVEGKCYAARLSVLSEGTMHGDIFSDEISIEKGGSFIGCSQLMEPSSTKIEHAIVENDADSELFIPDIQSTLIPEDNSIK
ncbi:polymer-forming cytoskeletal protein [Escherichia coli]|nr:polymer-forming cytoskeletal protein [Escherichia coli]